MVLHFYNVMYILFTLQNTVRHSDISDMRGPEPPKHISLTPDEHYFINIFEKFKLTYVYFFSYLKKTSVENL